MPKLAGLLTGLIVMAACAESTRSAENTTMFPTDPIQTSTTIVTPFSGPIRGARPDGTIYDIAFPTPRAEAIDQIQADLVVEFDGTAVPLEVVFRPGPESDAPAELVLPAAGWTVEIDIPDSLDAGTGEVIREAIGVSTEVEMPVLTLQAPIHWSKPPQITYDTFIVRTGCADEAAACNPTHAVSVIPRSGETLETPISVQSYALRPAADPDYLPPGPLSARWSPDVLWTGEEMVVWGGSADPGWPTFVDGAGYDPATGHWRILAPPPLAGEQATRAVLNDTKMIVIGEEATVAWEPGEQQWRLVAQGIIPPLDPGMSVTTGSEIFVWTSEGLYRLGAGGEWVVLSPTQVWDHQISTTGVFSGSSVPRCLPLVRTGVTA